MEYTVEGERTISSVTGKKANKNRNNDKAFLIVIGIVALMGTMVIYAFTYDVDEKKKIIEQKEIFKPTPTPNFQPIPARVTKLPEKITTKSVPTKMIVPIAKPVILSRHLSREELEAIRIKKAMAERRRKSVITIFDQLGSQNIDPVEAKKIALLDKANSMLDKKGTFSGMGLGAGGSSDIPVYDKNSINSQLHASKTAPVSAGVLKERNFLLLEGTMLNAVLETAIQSDLAGKIRAVVDENIYSENGRLLLVEKGSRLIGEYRSGVATGQTRLFVIWKRMITPWGIDVELMSPGTDPIGRSGVGGWVDNHFLERFGAAMLLTVIGAAADHYANESKSGENLTVNTSDEFNKQAEIALEHSINIPPTIKINQGEKISVFVARDINFKLVYELRNQ